MSSFNNIFTIDSESLSYINFSEPDLFDVWALEERSKTSWVACSTNFLKKWASILAPFSHSNLKKCDGPNIPLWVRSGIPLRSRFLGCPGPLQEPIITFRPADSGGFWSAFGRVLALMWCIFSCVCLPLVCGWAGGVPRVAHRTYVYNIYMCIYIYIYLGS